MPVPFSFGAATSAIPLSQLDANFNTPITLGNTAIQLGNTVTTLNNMTLANVTISSGNVTITNVTVTTANATTVNTTTLIATTANVTTGNVTNLISGNVTLTGGSITGTPISGSTGSFTTLTTSGTVTLNGGVANGVAYLDGSKVLTTGSALTFDGTNLGVGGSSGYETANRTTIAAAGVNSALLGFKVGGISAGYAFADASHVEFGAPTGRYLSWDINGEQMRLTSTGLGIGTSSPTAAKLHVAGYNGGSVYPIRMTSTNAGVEWAFETGGTNAATSFLAFRDIGNSATRMTLDASGNLGLGVTPSAWSAGRTTLQINGTTQPNIQFTGNPTNGGAIWTNSFFDGTSPKYVATGAASIFATSNGGFQWQIAPSGTAGNAITFTQAMTLDASGNLLVGTTSASTRFTLNVSGANDGITLRTTNEGAIGQLGMVNPGSNNDIQIGTLGVNNLRFFTNGTANERARITSGGNLLVATTINAGSPIVYGGTSTIRNVDSAQGGIETNNNNGNASVAGYVMRYIQNVGSGYHAWETSASLAQGAAISYTERARIDSSGNLLVGTTLSGIGTARAIVYNDSTNFAGIFANVNATSASTSVLRIYHVGASGGTSAVMLELLNASGSVVGTITSSGTATAYNTSSDYRLKEDVQPMTGALAKVAALKPCTYKWKSDGSAGEGFIAHEIAEVVPQAVTGEKDAVNEDGSIKPQGIDTSFLVATLTAAIQELKAEFDAYRATHP